MGRYIEVIDALGRVHWSRLGVAAGTERLVLPTAQLSPGGYCVRLHRQGVSYALRFLKQ